MITVTLDPISLNHVTDLVNAPFVVEGSGANAMKINVETESNEKEYLDTPTHGGVHSTGLKKIFDDMADNPNTGSIN